MICGKQIYASRSEASAVINGMNNQVHLNAPDLRQQEGIDKTHARKKKRSNKLSMTTYFCASCNGWHITTLGKRNNFKKKPQQTIELSTFNTKTVEHNKRRRPLVIHDNFKFKVK